MKKLFRLISALLIISTCCLALTSCGNDEKDEPIGGGDDSPSLNLVGSTIQGTVNWSDGAYKYADTYSLYFKTSSQIEGKLHQVVTETRTGKQTGTYDSFYKYSYVVKSNELIALTDNDSHRQSTLTRSSNGWYWDWPKTVLK